jgi:hypothetical protein
LGVVLGAYLRDMPNKPSPKKLCYSDARESEKEGPWEGRACEIWKRANSEMSAVVLVIPKTNNIDEIR